MPDITPAQEIILKVRKALMSPGDNIWKLMQVFCESFGVSYKRLSEQEKIVLRGIFRKAQMVQKSPFNFREKNGEGDKNSRCANCGSCNGWLTSYMNLKIPELKQSISLFEFSGSL